MWRTVVLVVTVPSAISNLQLLIPFAISESNEGAEDSVESIEDQSRDHDEPYSPIPAYAFSLDTESVARVPRVNIDSDSNYKPELVPSRSVYLNNMFEHQRDMGLKSSYKRDVLQDKRKGCEALARQHSVDARDVLIFLCSQLVEVLSARCDCCEKKNCVKEVRTSSPFGVPWFGQSAIRRYNLKSDTVPDVPPRNEIYV